MEVLMASSTDSFVSEASFSDRVGIKAISSIDYKRPGHRGGYTFKIQRFVVLPFRDDDCGIGPVCRGEHIFGHYDRGKIWQAVDYGVVGCHDRAKC
tara:strand:+ start:428 stop:715 length:288 start_codon:yes stop_codon:yes gene_type:complete